MAKPVISVFGSSSPLPESDLYGEARQIGKMLVEAGFAVATGGYGGTMAAISQGAAEAGGRVIGVTCIELEKWRPLPANEWVAEEVRKKTLRERLLHLVMQNDGMLVLPGGIGTLSEMALAWSLLQTGEIPNRPLVLLGPFWRDTIQQYAQGDFIRRRDLDLLYLANSGFTAVGYLKQRLAASLSEQDARS